MRKPNLTRRQFTASAALLSAIPASPPAASAAEDADAGRAYADAIFREFGARLSEDQKTDVRRLAAQIPKTSAALKTVSLSNADEPAEIFRVYRRPDGHS